MQKNKMKVIHVLAISLTFSATEVVAQEVKLWDSERSAFFPIIKSIINTSSKLKPDEATFEIKPDAKSGFIFTKPQTDWQSGTWLGPNTLLLDKNGFRIIIAITHFKGLESHLEEFIRNGHGYESIVQLDNLFFGSTQVTRVVRCQKLKGDVEVDEFRYFTIDSDDGILVKFSIFDIPPYKKTIDDWRNHMNSHYSVYENIFVKTVSLAGRAK